MGPMEFEVVKGAMLRIDPLAGDSLRVRSGEVWVTQFQDPHDYILKSGDSLKLNGKGATLAIAYKPTLLDLLRDAPAGVRERSERRARAKAWGVWALLQRTFG